MSRDRSGAARVVVVGGGISGLTTAYELARAGVDVVVLERAERCGGRVAATSIPLADGSTISLDTGAEAYATRGGAVAEFLAEIGLSEEMVSPAPLGSWLIDPHAAAPSGTVSAVPLPPSGTLGIPVAPLARDTVRALGWVGALRAAADTLLPRTAIPVTLAELVTRRQGAAVLDKLVRPVVRGVHGVDPEQLQLESLAALRGAAMQHRTLAGAARSLRQVASAAGGAVAGLRGGMQQLGDALITALERIDRAHPGRVTVHCSSEVTDIAELADQVDAVVLAVPLSAARRILGQPDRPTAQSQRGTRIAILIIDDDRLDAAPRGTGALVAHRSDPAADGAPADAAPLRAKALTHVTAKWPSIAERIGQGRHALRLSYDSSAVAGLERAEFEQQALSDANRILGFTGDEQLRPAQLVGFADTTWRVDAPPTQAERDALLRTAPQTVTYVGDWVAGTGLASVIPHARAAAAQLIASLRTDAQHDARLATEVSPPQLSHTEGAPAR